MKGSGAAFDKAARSNLFLMHLLSREESRRKKGYGDREEPADRKRNEGSIRQRLP